MRMVLSRLLMLLVVLLMAGGLAAEEPSRDVLLRQLEASDLLARTLEQRPERKPATRPADGISYDQLLREVIEELPENVAGDLAELNDYQLRTAVGLVHLGNLEAYLARGPLTRADVGLAEARAATSPSATASRSEVLRRYLEGSTQSVAETPGTGGMGVNSIFEEQTAPVRTGEAAVVAVLSGNSVERELGVASTFAPVDARRRGTQAMEHIDPRTLPMQGDVPEGIAMRADPAGNPSDARPTRNEVSRVVGTLGVDPDTAESLIMGRTTLADLRMRSGSTARAESIGGLVVNDPRWRAFYYGPTIMPGGWELNPRQQFEFSSGGGTYERADRRVNQDFDMRTQGAIDRRVNASHDRRTNTRTDPRVNY